ncbi:MAG: transglutaminase domain-containing protein [Ruminiclostridium sp.]|nr:transglutaminase domain-containing protein [Ruminiclostridium sp.]
MQAMKSSKILRICSFFIAFAISLSLCLSAGAEQSNTENKKPQKVYELVTSNNPEYSCKISIFSRSIVLSGCYKSDPVKDVTLRNSGTISTTLKSENDGSFTATINPSESLKADDVIDITLTSGVHLTYRVGFTNGGWYFPDNLLSEQNGKVLEKIMPTSAKSWAGYLTDELTEESVRKTLDEIKYLSDYIAKDIKGDYNKTIAIANWVSENIYYDRDARDSSVTQDTICIKNVLQRKRTVCAGYSNLFCALLEAQGIKAVNIKGTVTSDDIAYEELADGQVNHEWSAVWLDDRWVVIDTVWNSGNKYEKGEYRKGKCYQKYTDISPLALSFDHCAYLAESRYYFRATEYFEKQETTTTTATETTPPETTVKTEQTTITESTESKPQEVSSVTEETENYTSSVTPESSATDIHPENSEAQTDEEKNLWPWIIALAIIAVILIITDIGYLIFFKENKDKENEK